MTTLYDNMCNTYKLNKDGFCIDKNSPYFLCHISVIYFAELVGENGGLCDMRIYNPFNAYLFRITPELWNDLDMRRLDGASEVKNLADGWYMKVEIAALSYTVYGGLLSLDSLSYLLTHPEEFDFEEEE